MDSESFSFVDDHGDSSSSLFPVFADVNSAKRADADVQFVRHLRKLYPELNLTVVLANNVPLLRFADAGFATATLDTDSESVVRWRGYVPTNRRKGEGVLGDSVFFAKYRYEWAGEYFILFAIGSGIRTVNYILKEPDVGKGEDVLGHCAATDALVMAAVKASLGKSEEFVYVYDQYWTRSKELWKQVQKASWDKVILDQAMKDELKSVATTFFDSEDVYAKYGVPWRRGLIFYGPPGNGKTISIKALMHQLYSRKHPVPTLYVKTASTTYDLGQIFALARQLTPCLLVLEDVETIVNQDTRSYLFNQIDGIENNDGIMMVASTNYLGKLDPGLSKRPSRFDRKYKFPLPSRQERQTYAEFWRSKLSKSNASIEFPEKLCPAVAEITDGFSFASLQEAFVASLLELAREEVLGRGLVGGLTVRSIAIGAAQEEEDLEVEDDEQEANADTKDDPLDRYKLWVALKHAIAALRKDLDSGPKPGPGHSASTAPPTVARTNINGNIRRDQPVGAVINEMANVRIDDAESYEPAFWTHDNANMGPQRMALRKRGGDAVNEELAQEGVYKSKPFAETAFEFT